MASGPVSGTTVQIYQGTTLITAGTTDANGNVPFSLPFGQYTVIISKQGSTTTSYQLVLTQAYQEEVLNLPQNPIAVPVFQVAETLSEPVPSVTVNSSVSEQITETPQASNASSENESMSETPSVAILPTAWTLNIVVYPADTSLNQGTIIPSGTQNAGTGVAIPTTATTKQFALYSYEIADGSTVNNNSGTNSEPINTTHTYTFAAQTLGSRHNLFVYFKAAWEILVNVSGGGTTNISGTYEVAGGSSISVTATPNSGHAFAYWTLDGEVVSTISSFVCPAQAVGTSHVLIANFV